jgi:hypothetical protein
MTTTTLYQTKSSYPKPNAQSNLSGRTHYVADDTLRFHKSRILSAHVVYEGLLFAIVESVAMDMNNTKRGVRYVVFDVFGRVISRVSLEDCWRTRDQATKAMWTFIDGCDAAAITREGIENAEKWHARDMDDLRGKLATLEPKVA